LNIVFSGPCTWRKSAVMTRSVVGGLVSATRGNPIISNEMTVGITRLLFMMAKWVRSSTQNITYPVP